MIAAGGVNVLIEIVVCDLIPLRERGNYLAIIFGLIALGTALGPVVSILGVLEAFRPAGYGLLHPLLSHPISILCKSTLTYEFSSSVAWYVKSLASLSFPSWRLANFERRRSNCSSYEDHVLPSSMY